VVASFAGSMFQGVSPKFANSTAGMIGFSGLAGGVTAELTGGDFLKGFATGITIGALNHAMHQLRNHGETEDPPRYKYKGKIYEDKAELYRDILTDQVAEQFGIKDIVALATVVDGMGLLNKPFNMQGASKGTSILSKYGSKTFPQKMSKALPTISKRLTMQSTKVLGRFIGRSIPLVGWGVLVYDIGKSFYNIQVIYNQITR